jgi:hypothetical protein
VDQVITITSSDRVPLNFDMRVAGLAAYLDNFALIELSKPSRAEMRSRFLAAFKKASGSLLFSGTNGAELAMLKGDSAANVRAFLNEFGAHWVFVELDPSPIMKRESEGHPSACLHPQFMHAFFQDRKSQMLASGQILDLSAESFLQLGYVMDWLAPHSASLTASSDALDTAIVDVVETLRKEYEADPKALDIRLLPIPFDPARPATFVWNHLVRGLAINSKGHALKKGDGRDLCHAVVGAAYGSFAALDKHWKKRVESLPKPNGAAKVYYGPELGMLVDDLEAYAAVL